MKSNFWLKYGFLCIMTGSIFHREIKQLGIDDFFSNPVFLTNGEFSSSAQYHFVYLFVIIVPGIISLTMEDPCRILSTNNPFPL